MVSPKRAIKDSMTGRASRRKSVVDKRIWLSAITCQPSLYLPVLVRRRNPSSASVETRAEVLDLGKESVLASSLMPHSGWSTEKRLRTSAALRTVCSIRLSFLWKAVPTDCIISTILLNIQRGNQCVRLCGTMALLYQARLLSRGWYSRVAHGMRLWEMV